MGISAFVLKYRLGSSGYHHPAMLNDVSRAMRIVRSRADEWHIDTKRVGVIGSSAGGHLASTILTHYDAGNAQSTDTIERQSSRPDIGILCYPVITMGPLTHAGSKKNLLGDNPDPALVKLLSNEDQVTSETPPTFIFHTSDDKVVPVQDSLMFATALADAKVPFELHVYPHGNHGMGLGSWHKWDPEHRHPWTKACEAWLKAQGFTK
jgi:acetyl esterase/lipase